MTAPIVHLLLKNYKLQTTNYKLSHLPIHTLPIAPPDGNGYAADLHFFRSIGVDLAEGNDVGTVDAFELAGG